MRNRSLTALGALVLAMVTVAVPATPSAVAAHAPWTWVRVTQQVGIPGNSYVSVEALCPVGYTAITGGLDISVESTRLVTKQAEYRAEANGRSSWFMSLENTFDFGFSAVIVAECVETSDLPPISHHLQEFTRNSSGVWDGTVSCLNPGEVVLTGGVDWSNVNTREVSTSGPKWSGEAWRAVGHNNVAGAVMGVEAYCVDPADVPGYVRVERAQSGDPYWSATVTCPHGTRILNGGTEGRDSHASFPNLNRWTASGYSPDTTYVRAWCVSAGQPTVWISSLDPPGAYTSQTWARFVVASSDPAGFGVDLVCSVDGSAPQRCPSTASYSSLVAGPHEFVVFGETPDGRVSPLVSHGWTVDLAAPTVSVPSIPQVSLSEGTVAWWSATDDYSGVDHHEARFWRGRANGTTIDWTRPAAWTDLASPVVRVPAMAAGDTVCLSVRAVDGVGHASAWTTPRCTSRPYDDAALTAGDGWTRVTNTPYWNSTLTRTTLQDRTLQGPTVRSRQLGVLASVCPGCGSVLVRIGGTTVGTISLDRGTARNRQVLLLPAFPEKAGALTLVSATSGLSVRIDGLVTVRRPATGPPG